MTANEISKRCLKDWNFAAEMLISLDVTDHIHCLQAVCIGMPNEEVGKIFTGLVEQAVLRKQRELNNGGK